MSDSEFNLPVGALPPIFNDWNETALRDLIDNFAGFATSRVNRPALARSSWLGNVSVADAFFRTLRA
jgi:hypothetical protein